MTFDGKTYDPAQDEKRLSKQLGRVHALMCDGEWRSLAEIAQVTGSPESSVSARLRDLRKPKFGGYHVERRRRTRSLWEYRLLPCERVQIEFDYRSTPLGKATVS